MELFSIRIQRTFQLVSTPSTSLGNKILYKESDIARILQNNLIAPSK